MSRPLVALIAALALVAGVVAGCSLGGGDDDDGGGGGSGSASSTTRVEVIGDGTPSAEGGFDAQKIYEREAPGVVTVVSLFGGDQLDDLGDSSGGVGSGFVLNGKGEIATNAHVVTTGDVPDLRQAREVYVEFADGNQVKAEVRGYDPESDIALLKIDPAGLTLRPLPLGRSSDVEVGMPVAAIGSPFSEKQSLSVGVVSAVDRSISGLTAFLISGAIQTDAAINPGNSGGPLVDANGRVIGLNQQIKTSSGGGEGVGFAVPVDVARRSLDQLRGGGKVEYAYLGVETVAIYPQLKDRFDLPVAKGAWVQSVVSGGPAEQAGLKGGSGETVFQVRSFRDGGDVITKIDGRPVDDPDDLSTAVALLDPGTTVPIEAWHDGKREELELKLGSRPLQQPQNTG
jgi:S1-C subfamily serine protease